MKHILWGGLLTASLLFAQPGRLADRLRERQTERMDSLAKLLELSEKQREQVEDLEREHLFDLRGAGRDLAEARRALESASTDAGIDAAAAKVAQLSAQTLAARAKADLKIRKLLTPAQAEKYDAWRRSQRGGMPPFQRE